MPHRSRLPLVALRSFEAVARLGGVRPGARELHVTEGAVSQQIRQLEAELGVPLFSRAVHRRLVLTEDGTALLRRLTSAFDLMELGVRDAQSTRMERRLRLRILPTLAIRWFIPRLADFFQHHADIDIEVSTAAERTASLQTDDDFVAWHGSGEWRGVHAQLLFRDAYVPVCRPDLAPRLREPGQLAQATLLHSMLRPDAWRIWLQGVGESALDCEAGLRFANAALAYQAAIDGLGVAIGQHAYLRGDIKAGRLVMPIPQTVRTNEGYFLVCEEERARLPRYRLFLDWIRKQARTSGTPGMGATGIGERGIGQSG